MFVVQLFIITSTSNGGSAIIKIVSAGNIYYPVSLTCHRFMAPEGHVLERVIAVAVIITAILRAPKFYS